jgi:hypothetical protein
MLARCESEWAFERQWLFEWKRGAITKEKKRARKGVLCWKEEYIEGIKGAQNEKECQIYAEERGRRLRSAKTSLSSADGDWGTLIIVEERKKEVWGLAVRNSI